MMLIFPFGGPVHPEWVKSHCAARRKLYPETSDLFEACLAGETSAIVALQLHRDWLAVLSTQFIEVTTDASGEQ